jgi:hypothetical protein
LSGDELRSRGIHSDFDGNILAAHQRAFPCLHIAPMGFSWAFWIVQALCKELIGRCGFPPERCSSRSWPAPDVQSRPITLPYCDNLAVLGASMEQVDAALATIMHAFSFTGFKIHDISRRHLVSSLLGARIDGIAFNVGHRDHRIMDLYACPKHMSDVSTRYSLG